MPQVEETLSKETARVKLLQQVAIIANESRSIDDALQRALVQIAEHLGWPFGHVYKLAPDGSNLVSGDIWYCNDRDRFARLIRITRQTTIALGEGWLGRAAAEGLPAYNVDLSLDLLPIGHSERQDVGVKAGFALPVRTESRLVAVLEFLSPQALACDADFLDLMAHIGAQLGYVSERQVAQERLQRKEMLLAQSERIAHLGSWEWDLESSTITWSDELLQIYGVDAKELGTSYDDFIARVHPDDRSRFDKRIRGSIEHGQAFNFHHRIIRPDGESRVILGQGRPAFDENGKVVSLFGTSQDVSENIALQRRLLRQADQLKVLEEMGHAVTSTFDQEVIFQEMLKKLTALLDAQGVFVLLLQGDEFIFAFTTQTGADDPTGRRIPSSSGVAGEVLAEGKALALFGDEARQRTFAEIVRALGYRPGALLVAPLRLRGNIIGVLEAMHKRVDGFDQEDLQVLEAAASWTAIAVQNARLFRRLRLSHDRSRRLAKRVVTAQEEERRRISRELHDEAGQALTALKLNLEMIKGSLTPEASNIEEQLADAIVTADQTMEQIRRLAHGLHPPVLDKFGLGPAAEGLCDEIAQRSELDIEIRVDSLPQLDDETAISLYRVLQEALTNAVKHSEASVIVVELTHDHKWIVLSVMDDGRGFEASDETITAMKSMGLMGMQERVEQLDGQLHIDSSPGRGARITARVPYQDAKEDS